MRALPIGLFAMWLLFVLSALAEGLKTEPQKQSLTQLEHRLGEIDAELEKLAVPSLRSGIGAIGYRSKTYDSADNPEWIQINLKTIAEIDSILLVPAIWRHVQKGFVDDGFPAQLRIRAGREGDREGTLIAAIDRPDHAPPRMAPLIIPCLGTTASWVRIEAIKLSRRHLDQKYLLQLSEILIFSGQENVALHQPVSTSSKTNPYSPNWQEQFLVDGFMPYIMNAADGEQSLAFMSNFLENKPYYMAFDIGAEVPISRIHLHPVEQSDTVPQSSFAGYGFPREMSVEVATQADFSDAVTLMHSSVESPHQTSPIMIWNVVPTIGRYIRFNIEKPFAHTQRNKLRYRIGFAEIEVFSEGNNVLLHKPVLTNIDNQNEERRRKLAALTDGHNLYGNILPIRDWLEQLGRRHDLENERPYVQEALNEHYVRQERNIRRMAWLTAGLIVSIAFIILISRNAQIRQAAQIKERFAADLHDELGANIHTIALLGDLARRSKDDPDKMIDYLNRARVFTERSGEAARYCTNMLEADGLYDDLVEDMRRTTARVLGDLQYGLEFQGEPFLKRLPSRKHIDLFLFYKECLINIIRHSGATQVNALMKATSQRILLTVSDNGQGLGDTPPASLQRRARLLKGKLTIEPPSGGGARIILICRTHAPFSLRIGANRKER